MATSSNKVFAVCFISALFMMASFQMSEAISECAQQCVPFCMKDAGNTVPACEVACENYCKQSDGDVAAVNALMQSKSN
uniref:Thionin-like protein 2 n=1 Tax=Nelumbo nucifera TaxID=4432 RepID=A0A822Y6U9_NELNU|nr:TPA_asm: hypothetical protein HUJ06_028223 [Nelumbo nucifera]